MFFFVEPRGPSRWRMVPFLLLGAAVVRWCCLKAMPGGSSERETRHVPLGPIRLVWHQVSRIIGLYHRRHLWTAARVGFRTVFWFGVSERGGRNRTCPAVAPVGFHPHCGVFLRGATERRIALALAATRILDWRNPLKSRPSCFISDATE